MKTINTTLLIIEKDNQLLLGEKLSGFGKGKINGVGGKQKENESIIATMLRETFEEFNITPTDFKLRGILDYNEVYKNERAIIRTHIFTATNFVGNLSKSDEMMPVWIDKDKIPYDKMFGDDILWYDQLLSGKNFRGEILFDDDFNITSHSIDFFDDEIVL